nr:hypothetical protein [Emcibacter sp.]
MGAQRNKPYCFSGYNTVYTRISEKKSGKIIHRILRKTAENEFGNLGDTSTLADPPIVDNLVGNRQNK